MKTHEIRGMETLVLIRPVADPGFGVPGAPTNRRDFDRVLFVKLITILFLFAKILNTTYHKKKWNKLNQLILLNK